MKSNDVSVKQANILHPPLVARHGQFVQALPLIRSLLSSIVSLFVSFVFSSNQHATCQSPLISVKCLICRQGFVPFYVFNDRQSN